MVSVWVKNFIQDEDLCLVEYKSFRDAANINLPETTLCFPEPFVKEKLNGLGTNATEYIKYLSGDSFNEKLARINLSNVTFNFENLYSGSQALYKNGSVNDNAKGFVKNYD